VTRLSSQGGLLDASIGPGATRPKRAPRRIKLFRQDACLKLFANFVFSRSTGGVTRGATNAAVRTFVGAPPPLSIATSPQAISDGLAEVVEGAGGAFSI
jgi:hypothetical protein